jgi:hypothetical protein
MKAKRNQKPGAKLPPEHGEALRINATLDVLQALWRSNSEAARDSAFVVDALRYVAGALGIPYLAVLLQREAQVNGPTFTLEDLDELLGNPVALEVVRKRWPAEREAA